MLTSLVDKSLLQVGPRGRYDFHPLLHQYAHEKLVKLVGAVGSALAQVQAVHARYYFELADTLRYHDDFFTTLRHDMENLQAAWEWALDQRDPSGLRRSDHLKRLHHQLNRQAEGVDLLSRALDALTGEDAQSRETRGVVWVDLAYLQYWAGRLGQATGSAQEGLALLPHNDQYQSWLALRLLGMVALSVGEWAAAEGHLEQAVTIARQVYAQAHDARWAGYLIDIISSLGELALSTGRYGDAETLWQEAAALSERHERALPRIRPLWNLAALWLRTGNPHRAKATFEVCLEFYNAQGEEDSALLADLALACCAAGAYPEARRYAQDALRLLRSLTSNLFRSETYIVLGRAFTALGSHRQAAACIHEGLTVAQSTQFVIVTLYALTATAELWLSRGESAGAAALLRFCATHPNARWVERDLAHALLATLGPQTRVAAPIESLAEAVVLALEPVT